MLQEIAVILRHPTLPYCACCSDDILDNYNIVGKLLVPKVIVSILSGGIGLALVFTYPVLAFELRHSMDHLVFGPRPFS